MGATSCIFLCCRKLSISSLICHVFKVLVLGNTGIESARCRTFIEVKKSTYKIDNLSNMRSILLLVLLYYYCK